MSFIPLRVVWCILAGYGLAALGSALFQGWRGWTGRHRGAAALCAALLGLLAAPALEGLVKQLGQPVVEFDHANIALADIKEERCTAAGLPLAVFVLTAFFMETPQELVDAARVDGAGRGVGHAGERLTRSTASGQAPSV